MFIGVHYNRIIGKNISEKAWKFGEIRQIKKISNSGTVDFKLISFHFRD